MCGIAGIISANKNLVSRPLAEKMAQVLAHRGPDGQQTWISPSGMAGLAHRRLAIIDLSPEAAQPMHYLERYTIIYNGEIYNYPEIRKELEKLGHRFVTSSDTEVILGAYAAYGVDCLRFFDGMFAFAIWDEEKKELFAARDRFGEKPFFYSLENDCFLFGSEMKALWEAGLSRQANFSLLYNFLTLGYSQDPDQPGETFYRNIFKLPARHYLIYEAETHRCRLKAYWDIDPTASCTLQEEEALEQFGQLLKEAVRRRLRSDVPVGSSLSGGVDSSSIVALCASLGDKRFSHEVFTAGFPEFALDETQAAAGMAQTLHLRHHLCQPDARDFVRYFPQLLYHQEEPFLSASTLAQFMVYRMAADQQVKVLLDGQGADETLAGYSKYLPYYWQELWKENRPLYRQERQSAEKAGRQVSWSWKNILAAQWPGIAGFSARQIRMRQQQKMPGLHPEFVRAYGKSYYQLPATDRLNHVLYYNSLVNGLEELLRLADRNAMASGVEIRLPFLSHELVSFVFSLPARMKIRDGFGKWILRKSMEPLVPPTILWNTHKIGFEPPQQSWMETEPVRELIQASRQALVSAGILLPAVLQEKQRPHTAYAADNLDWRYLSAGAWLPGRDA